MHTSRKLILFIATSLDGFIADQNHSLDWLEKFPHPEGEDYGYADLMGRIDTTLMGRETFRFLENFQGPFPYPDTKNYVFTRSLKATHLPVELVPTDPVAFVAALKINPARIFGWLVAAN